MIGERSDREAGDQCESIEGGDEHLAQTLIPLVVGVLAPQCYDTVHGDGNGHVEDVGARQGADEELQWLPLFLLGTDAEDAPSVGQDGHARADQPSQRVGIDDIILHGGYLIHHNVVGQGGAWWATRNCWQESGTRKEKEEVVVVVGRRGRSTSGWAGILSGWAHTLHGFHAARKARGCGETKLEGHVRCSRGRTVELNQSPYSSPGVEEREDTGQRQKNSQNQSHPIHKPSSMN